MQRDPHRGGDRDLRADHGALETAGALAKEFLDSLPSRAVGPPVSSEWLAARLPVELPDAGQPAEDVIRELSEAVEPGLVASAGPRYFGYVVGGALPAALAADWLTSAWDQQAGVYNGSPAAAVVERRVSEWLVDLFGLPAQCSTGYTTGTAQAHLVALAAARWRLLGHRGWDVHRRGLRGAPELTVVTSDQRHVTVDAALRFLGIGEQSVRRVATDEHGRMRADELQRLLDDLPAPAIVCAQAGNVNTGAVDPLRDIGRIVRDRGGWLHIDGAFGMWARVASTRSHLVDGLELASSWATDGHKWLNVPYDSGMVLVADREAHQAATATSAAYSAPTDDGDLDGDRWVLEFSRRARGFSLYAALRSLGRAGLSEMIDRHCRLAGRFAEGAGQLPGATVLNDVVLNQVLLDLGPDTEAVIERIQADGVFWAGRTQWLGRPAMRVSISGWATTDADIARAVAALGAALR